MKATTEEGRKIMTDGRKESYNGRKEGRKFITEGRKDGCNGRKEGRL